MAMTATRGEKIFHSVNYIFFIIIGILTLTPFLNVVAKSFSSEAAVMSGQVTAYPIGLQFGTYKYVVQSPQFLNSFKISVFVTTVGSLLAITITTLCAYPLSKPHLKGRKGIMLILIFAMLFSGGMIPNYLLVKSIGLIDKVWALIIPEMMTVFNVLIVKNYFEGIPDSMEEAAKIDGASNLRIFYKIILPVSLPVLATVALFYAVSYWNSYFSSVLYISKPSLKPLQKYLFELVMSAVGSNIEITRTIDDEMNITPDSIRSAAVVAATVPVLLVYPFLQKYFAKGLVIGSTKG